MRTLLLTTALLCAAPTAFAQTVLLDDATVVSASGETTTTDMIWTDGKITRQAQTLSAPDGAATITGTWVTSGLFASMSSLGMTDIGSSGSGNDVSSEDSPTSASERAADSFNPRNPHIDDVRRRGVTHAVIAPRSSGGSIFAGTGAVISLTGEFDSVLNDEAFVMINLGETGANRAGGSRAAALRQLRAALDDAEGFFRRYSDGPDGGDVLSRQDARALRQAASGDIPLMISADRASDLLAIVALKDNRPELDIIIVGAAEGWDVADSLADADIRVIVDPLHNLPGSFESVGARFDNVTRLRDAGVDYAIANLSALGVTKPSSLAQHAGNAVVSGLDWSEAFAAASSVPMDWFGVDASTTVVWDGDPLEITSAPIAVTINGVEQDMSSRTMALRDRYNPTSDDTRPYKYR
jgi:imidazolonepropionase-like amidohydrolase